MSIVTFWNEDREQSGRTLTSVAVATRMAIERNFKILLLSTSFSDNTMKNCFGVNEVQRNLKLFGAKNNNIAVENGIEGLSKLITSNKLEPSTITDYTKVIFKGRLEVITGYVGVNDKSYAENYEDYKRFEEAYIELIRLANQYYDMVLVDLDKALSSKVKEEIMQISNLNIYVFSQRMESFNKYNELKKINKNLYNSKCIPVIGKYINGTKYNLKNLTKYLDEKKGLNTIPFNMLYFESAEEGTVVDLFLKIKNIKDKTDENYIFMQNVLKLTDDIIKRLQELQMKMR